MNLSCTCEGTEFAGGAGYLLEVFAIVLTLVVLLATTLLLFVSVVRLSRMSQKFAAFQFEPLLLETQQMRRATAEVAAKVNQRTEGLQ